MAIIRNPRITMAMGHIGIAKFVQFNRNAGKAVKFSYRKADGTVSDYVAVNAPKEALQALQVNAAIGNTRKASPNVLQFWIAGKGWRSFKPEGFQSAKCGTIAMHHEAF